MGAVAGFRDVLRAGGRGLVRVIGVVALVLAVLGLPATAASAAGTGTITGSVTTPDGPLAGTVAVTAFRWDDGTSTWQFDGLLRYQSASAFTVSDLAPGTYQLKFGDPASRSPYLPTFHPNALAVEDGSPIEVRSGETTAIGESVLRVGGTISGNVTLPAGVDLAQPLGASAERLNEDGVPQSVRSALVDPVTGHYRIVGLPDGDFVLRFDTTSYGITDEYYDGVVVPELATKVSIRDAGQVDGIDASLDPYTSLIGSVRDQYGDPAHARVVLYRWEPTVQRWRQHATKETTERTGNYELTMVPPGQYRLRFELFDEPEVADVFNGGTASFEDAPRIEVAGSSPVRGLDARFGTGLEISGLVRDPDGDPAVATVSALEWDDYRQTWVTRREVATSDGTYAIRGLHPGAYMLRFRSEDLGLHPQFHDGSFSPDVANPLQLSTSLTGVDLQLRDDDLAGAIRGTVSGTSDRPFAGIVRARAAADDTVVSTATPGTGGSYVLRGLAPGAYRVEFDASASAGLVDEYYDDATDAASSTTVSVATKQTVSPVDAVLAPDAAVGGVAGRVTGPDGTPVSGAVQVKRPNGSLVTRIRTDPSTGDYRIWGLAPGAYRIQADPDHPQMREVSYGEESQAWPPTVDVVAGSMLSGLDISVDCVGPCSGTPTVSGTARVGETLTVDPGLWTPAATTFRYQWFHGATGDLIPGATGRTYTLTGADLGHRMWVSVTGDFAGKSAGANGVLKPYVVEGVSVAGTVDLVGTPAVGHSVEATLQGWAPENATITYAWFRNGVLVEEERSARMPFEPVDLGAEYRVRVTATAIGYPARVATSAPVTVRSGAVVAGTVAISGSPHLDGRLTATPSRSWSSAAFSYQWLRGGVAISGATRNVYRPTSADLGRRLSVRVTGSSPASASASATSAATPAVKSVTSMVVSSQPSKKRVALSIRVRAKAASPTGVIRVRVDGKVRKSVRLKDGRASVVVRGLSKGKHRLSVEYGGTSKVTSAKVTRTVRTR